MNITMLGSGSYRGSLSIRIVSIGQQLARQGWSVSVIVPTADKYNDFKNEVIESDGVVKILQPWQFVTKWQFVNLLPYLISSLVVGFRSRPDVIYLYKPSPITIFGVLLKYILRVPLILDLDDLGSEVMRAESQSWLQVQLVAMCERISLKYASAVVVTSALLEKRVRAQHRDKPIMVLSNGVAPEHYPIRHEKPVRPAVYYYGMINRFSLIEPFLAAIPNILQAVPEATFTIIGGGKSLDEAVEYAHRHNFASSIKFTGMTDMLGALEFTDFGDIGICYQPDVDTVRAASNMKVFQYMAMSTVTVVSDVGELPNYLDNNRAGIVVEANNHHALGNAIIGLLRDQKGRSRRSLHARQLAETVYSWNYLGQRLGTFIEGHLKSEGEVTHHGVLR